MLCTASAAATHACAAWCRSAERRAGSAAPASSQRCRGPACLTPAAALRPPCTLAPRLTCRRRALARRAARSGVGSQGPQEDPQEDPREAAAVTSLVTPIVTALVLASAVALVAANREVLGEQLTAFADGLQSNPYGVYEFLAGYFVCEMLGVPALPLTMSAGALFGPVKGAVFVSLAGLTAAGSAFLVARYLMRDAVVKALAGNDKWESIDRALGANSFKVILLLRISPLLPFSLSNYMYGCTKLQLAPYLAGSWLGMLPGTIAYVYAGFIGRDVISNGMSVQEGVGAAPLAAGALLALGSAGFIGKLVKDAMEEGERERNGAEEQKNKD